MNEILKKIVKSVPYKKVLPIDVNDAYKEGFKNGAEYALSHQWISVDEALPEANENVLALIGGVPVIARGYHVRARRDISHWMPIPKFEPNKTE